MGCAPSRRRRLNADDADSDGNGGGAGGGGGGGGGGGACRLSTRLKGPDVVLRDHNTVVSGAGTVLSSAVLMQDRVHFEVEVLRPGPICVGVCGINVDTARPLDFQGNSWALVAAESKVTFGDDEKVALDEPLKLAMSDILGCVFDQETGQIGFYHNGRPLSFVSPLTAKRLRGQLALAVSVGPPAEVEVTFNADEFSYPLEERGYTGIMVARSLI